MPRGDGSGPAGAGPMTGRAAGYCAGYAVPGFANGAFGRGMGRGRMGGFGGGFGGRGGRGAAPQWGVNAVPNYFNPPVSANPQTEMETLQSQAKNLAGTLEQINKRIADLQKKDSGK